MKLLLTSFLLLFSTSVLAGMDEEVRQLSSDELQTIVEHCNDSAAVGSLAYGDIMVCSVAYDELVHHRYGSYEAYVNRNTD